MTRSFLVAATPRLAAIRRHGWLVGLVAACFIAPWVAR
jgi:hypothetical protein